MRYVFHRKMLKDKGLDYCLQFAMETEKNRRIEEIQEDFESKDLEVAIDIRGRKPVIGEKT